MAAISAVADVQDLYAHGDSTDSLLEHSLPTIFDLFEGNGLAASETAPGERAQKRRKVDTGREVGIHSASHFEEDKSVVLGKVTLDLVRSVSSQPVHQLTLI
jgi:hypothetical protein